jgi:diguanylate cyclase (GGDEF)-like protein
MAGHVHRGRAGRLVGLAAIAAAYVASILFLQGYFTHRPPLWQGLLAGAGLMGPPVALLLVERRRSARTISLAFRDDLTNLPNRRYFIKATTEALRTATPGHLAIVLFDVDDLKGINDSCGHLAGDELLRRAARRLQEATGELGTLCRIGGDEFAVVLPEDGANRMFQVLRSVEPFSVRFKTCNHLHVIGLSAGFSSNERGDDLDGIFRRADRRLTNLKHRLRPDAGMRQQSRGHLITLVA